MRPELNNVWFFDCDFVWDLFPLSEFVCFLNMIKLFLILSDGNLLRDNVRSLLLDSVLDPFSAFIWHRELLFIRNFVVNSVRNFL